MTIKKGLTTLGKIAISALLLYFVYTKISFVEVWSHVRHMPIGYFSLAILAFILSQVVSSNRLLGYFHAVDYKLASKDNLALYWIGMFYNFFIPGGIGGDAYKVFHLNKRHGWSAKTLATGVIADRSNGLIAICVWMVLLFPFLGVMPLIWSIPLALVTLVAGVLLAKWISKMVFTSFQRVYYPALLHSIILQGLQLLCVFFIMESLGCTTHRAAYFLLFFASSVLSIFSFSGVGVREFVFSVFAASFLVDPEISVSIGFVFTIITFLTSAPGVILVIWPRWSGQQVIERK